MTREIKFRAWVKDGELCAMRSWDEIKTSLSVLFRTHNDAELDTVVLMQFTGLRDKKGKEIYEGDIVRHTNTEVGLLQVQMWEGQWVGVADDTSIEPLFDMYEERTKKTKKTAHGYKSSILKIIGNIWEQPDLISL